MAAAAVPASLVVLVLAERAAVDDGSMARTIAALDDVPNVRVAAIGVGESADSNLPARVLATLDAARQRACVIVTSRGAGSVDASTSDSARDGGVVSASLRELVAVGSALGATHFLRVQGSAGVSDAESLASDSFTSDTKVADSDLSSEMSDALTKVLGASGATGTQTTLRSVLLPEVRQVIVDIERGRHTHESTGKSYSKDGKSRGVPAAALLVDSVQDLPSVGRVLVGRVVGPRAGKFVVRGDTRLAVAPSGESAVAGAMEVTAKGSGASSQSESAEVGDQVALVCRGSSSLPAAYAPGALVVAGDGSGALPTGFTCASRFQAVVLRSRAEPVSLRVGSEVGVLWMNSVVNCTVTQCTPLEAGKDGAWFVEMQAARPVLVCTHHACPSLGAAAVLLRGQNTDPCIGALLFVAPLGATSR